VNEEPGSIEVKRVRTGSCHRCGWKSAVERVTRHERRQFKTTLKYRWLCTECVGELALRRSPVDDGKAMPRLRAVPDRKVA
jgi:hypothetical protein